MLKAVFAVAVFALFYVLAVLGYLVTVTTDEIKKWNKGRCQCGGSFQRTPSVDVYRSRGYRCNKCQQLCFLEMYRPGV